MKEVQRIRFNHRLRVRAADRQENTDWLILICILLLICGSYLGCPDERFIRVIRGKIRVMLGGPYTFASVDAFQPSAMG